MPHYDYVLVDVFTDRPFGGNPLAVFPQASRLSTVRMQQIARELNLSESAFVLPPETADADFRVRIFTPAVELPTAGHPTVGTAFALSHTGQITPDQQSVVFQEGIGAIPVSIKREENAAPIFTMRQPLPVFGPVFEDRGALAAMLNIHPDDFLDDLPAQVVSTGVPYLFVPLRTLDAVRRCSLRIDLWAQHLQHFPGPHAFVFTREVENPAAHVHSRMFAPALGIPEDPATGSASGPLGCYLVQHHLVTPAQAGHIISEQGVEMGRPSLIHIHIGIADGEFSSVEVGGTCVLMGEGRLMIADAADSPGGQPAADD